MWSPMVVEWALLGRVSLASPSRSPAAAGWNWPKTEMVVGRYLHGWLVRGDVGLGMGLREVD